MGCDRWWSPVGRLGPIGNGWRARPTVPCVPPLVKSIPASSVPLATDVARRLVMARRLPVELEAHERSGGRPDDWSASPAGARWSEALWAVKRRAPGPLDRSFFDATTRWAGGIMVQRHAIGSIEPLLQRLSGALAVALEEAERSYVRDELPVERYEDAIETVAESVRDQLDVRFVMVRARHRDRTRAPMSEPGRGLLRQAPSGSGPIVPGTLWLDEDWRAAALLHMRVRDHGATGWDDRAAAALDAIAERHPIGPTARLARLVAEEARGELASVERAEAMVTSAPVGMTEVMRTQHLDAALG